MGYIFLVFVVVVFLASSYEGIASSIKFAKSNVFQKALPCANRTKETCNATSECAWCYSGGTCLNATTEQCCDRSFCKINETCCWDSIDPYPQCCPEKQYCCLNYQGYGQCCAFDSSCCGATSIMKAVCCPANTTCCAADNSVTCCPSDYYCCQPDSQYAICCPKEMSVCCYVTAAQNPYCCPSNQKCGASWTCE